ncbi:MAG: hypothetical protein ACJ8C4_07010 [Gemmataceae bacterium]
MRQIATEHATHFVAQNCTHMCTDRRITAFTMTRDLIVDALGDLKRRLRPRVAFSVN